MTNAEQALASADTVQAASNDLLSQWDKIQMLLANWNNLLLVGLFVMGIIMKRSQRVKDNDIVWLVPSIGAALGAICFGFVAHQTQPVMGAIQGLIYGGMTIFAHQFLKQKMPGIEAMLYETQPDPASTKPNEPVQPDPPKP